MLHFIQRPETDPYYNLAAEEYLLKIATMDTFMTWQNEPSVIIGKHQNAIKEINHPFIQHHNLPVIRRITGGGTVYHDPGNINFSFIFTNRKENLVDFREFTKPIILFLQSLGLEAVFEGKNNISINGLKVSGNSAHLHKHNVLYHGTLLFDTNLEILQQAISGKEELFNDKAVRSIRAKVFNIKDLLVQKLSIEEFILRFQDFVFNYFGGKVEVKLCEDDLVAIRKLADEKYRSFQWNYGYSAEYEFNNRWIFEGDEYSVGIKVKEGIIRDIKLSGPENATFSLIEIERRLTGILHNRDAINNTLKSSGSTGKNDPALLNQIAEHLF